MDYVLIDRFQDNTELFRNNNLEEVAHELLSHLHNHLLFMVSVGAKVTKLNFDKYVIKQVAATINKSFPLVLNEYVLDDNFVLLSHQGSLHLKELSATKYLLGKVNQQLSVLMNKPQPVVRPTVTAQKKSDRQQLKELLAETKLLTDNVLNVDDVPDTLELIEEGEEDSEPDVDSESSPIDDEYAEQIKKQFMQMKQVRNSEKEGLEEIKQKAEEIEKEVVEERCEYDAVKMDLRRLKEKEEEKLRVFEHDKNVTYVRIKKSIEENNLTEENIPPMFAERYPIFKFMENEGLLDVDGDYETYCQLYDEMHPPQKNEASESYIPHNIHYLPEEEQAKYQNIVDKQKATVKPLDEILKETEDSEEDPDDLTGLDQTATFE